MKKIITSILGISLLTSSVVEAHENEEWNLKPLGLDGIVKLDKEAPQFTGLLYSEQHSSDTVILKKSILPTTVGVECISKINPIVNSETVKKEPLILAFITAVLAVFYEKGQLLPQSVLDSVKYEQIIITGNIFQKKDDSIFTVEIKAFGLSVIAQFSILNGKDSKGFPKVSCAFRNDGKINDMKLESFRKYLTIQQHVNNSLTLIKPFIRELKTELKEANQQPSSRSLRTTSDNFDDVMEGALMLAQPLVEVLDSDSIDCSEEPCDYTDVNDMFRTWSLEKILVSGSDYKDFLDTYTPSSNVEEVLVINDTEVPDLENETDALHTEKVVKIPLKTTFTVDGETIEGIKIVSSLNTETDGTRSKIVVQKDNTRRCCSIKHRFFFFRW
jgi:hypothetical protein